jgi:uncharacterized membrane protein YbaN (DUF454 family)
MIDVDLGSGAGVGAAVAAVAWLIIQRVLKPLLSLWAGYDAWPDAAKAAAWSGLIATCAGVWAWKAFGAGHEVFVAVAVALTAGSGIQATAKLGQSDDRERAT